jgi:RNA polymerase sigma factor (sigma-70 family)
VAGDPEFERFYEKEAQAVFRAVYLLSRDAALAEDATQEAFARALERWDRLRSKSWVGGWVVTTALNVSRRSMRKRTFRLTSTAPGDPPSQEEAIDLWQRVRALPLRQQQTVVLYYRFGTPVEEIARILDCAEGTVRTHLARAREALRLTLEPTVDER